MHTAEAVTSIRTNAGRMKKKIVYKKMSTFLRRVQLKHELTTPNANGIARFSYFIAKTTPITRK